MERVRVGAKEPGGGRRPVDLTRAAVVMLGVLAGLIAFFVVLAPPA